MTSVTRLGEVVHGGGKLIGPVAVAVADQQIAALIDRPLLLRSVNQVVESFGGGRQAHTDASPFALGQLLVGTRPRISQLGTVCRGRLRDRAARAFARVEETAVAQHRERPLVDLSPIALSTLA